MNKHENRMNKSFAFFNNPCNRYIALWCIYLLQGTLYAEGSLISRSILLLLILVSLYHVIIILQDKKAPQIFKFLFALIVLYTIHGTFSFLEGGVTAGMSNQSIAVDFLQSFYISVLPIFSFYYYAKRGLLSVNSLRSWTIVFVLVAISLFYKIQKDALEKTITGFDDVTNNAGYVITALIPCVFVFKKQWMQYVLLAFCIIFAMYSMKRGAIITGGVAILLYIYTRTRYIKSGNRFLFLATTVLLGVFVFNYLQETIFQNSYFQYRIETTLEGRASGREELVPACLNYYFNNENIIQQIFGLGANGTLSIVGNGAHNDWVELLVNQGLIGFVIFLLFWLSFYRKIKDESLSQLSRDALTLVFVICFLRTFYSQSINDISIFLSSIIGLALYDGFAVIKVHNSRTYKRN